MQWFDNDGGPLLVLPREALRFWEGSDPPSGGRHVDATFRYDPEGPPTDYDRACDVHGWAEILEAGSSWVLVLGESPQSAAWLPDTPAGEYAVVDIEFSDDDSAEWLQRTYRSVAHANWQPVSARLPVHSGELMLMHAASGPEVHAGPTRSDGIAVIGDGLTLRVPTGHYAVHSTRVNVPDSALVAFHRFRLL